MDPGCRVNQTPAEKTPCPGRIFSKEHASCSADKTLRAERTDKFVLFISILLSLKITKVIEQNWSHDPDWGKPQTHERELFYWTQRGNKPRRGNNDQQNQIRVRANNVTMVLTLSASLPGPGESLPGPGESLQGPGPPGPRREPSGMGSYISHISTSII